MLICLKERVSFQEEDIERIFRDAIDDRIELSSSESSESESTNRESSVGSDSEAEAAVEEPAAGGSASTQVVILSLARDHLLRQAERLDARIAEVRAEQARIIADTVAKRRRLAGVSDSWRDGPGELSNEVSERDSVVATSSSSSSSGSGDSQSSESETEAGGTEPELSNGCSPESPVAK